MFVCSILILAFCYYVYKQFCPSYTMLESSQRSAILITGCDSGIGLATAKYFHRSTSYSIICTFVNPPIDNDDNSKANRVASEGFEELDALRVQDQARGSKQRVFLTQLNLLSNDSIDALELFVASCKAEKKFDSLWAVINNAGCVVFAEFDWQTREHLETVIGVNFLGQVKLTKKLLSHIIEAKGRFVNVSSVGDSTVFTGLSIYSATKSAVTTFSKNLHHEISKLNCHVVVFRPGVFAGLTKIIDNQDHVMKQMQATMGERKLKLYSKYFNIFMAGKAVTIDTRRQLSPESMESSPLFNDFRVAVMAKSPPYSIACAPFLYRVFYYLYLYLPLQVQFIGAEMFERLVCDWRRTDINMRYLKEIQSNSDEHYTNDVNSVIARMSRD